MLLVHGYQHSGQIFQSNITSNFHTIKKEKKSGIKEIPNGFRVWRLDTLIQTRGMLRDLRKA